MPSSAAVSSFSASGLGHFILAHVRGEPVVKLEITWAVKQLGQISTQVESPPKMKKQPVEYHVEKDHQWMRPPLFEYKINICVSQQTSEEKVQARFS